MISGAFAIARYLARVYRSFNLYGQTVLDAAQVDHWLELSLSQLAGSDHGQTRCTVLPATFTVHGRGAVCVHVAFSVSRDCHTMLP